MYTTYVIGFGIGWCLAYIVVLILLSNKRIKQRDTSAQGYNTDVIKDLSRKLSDIKSQFENVRFDELKNREEAYSRNPKGFNYDYQGFFKDYEDRVKNLDTEIDKCLKKCSSVLDELSRQKRVTEQGKPATEKNPFAVVNIIGLIGILIANFIYFTKIL